MPSTIPKTDARGDFPESSFKYGPIRHVRRLFVEFLQGLFGQAPRGGFHWEQDAHDSEIVISDESPLKTETLNDRPGICLTRAPIAFSHLGFDDMLRYDAQTGKKTKGVLVPGTMVINCCSRVDLESEQLAWVVMNHLWLLRDLMQRAGFYDVGRNLQMGAPSPAGALVSGDSADEWVVTSVTAPYHFQWTASVTPLDQQMVNDISFRLRAVSSASPTGVPSSSSASIDPPFQVETSAPSFPRGEKNDLPLTPHPLNPAQSVVIRPVRADRPGLRPPMIGGRRLPLLRIGVEESLSHLVGLSTPS